MGQILNAKVCDFCPTFRLYLSLCVIFNIYFVCHECSIGHTKIYQNILK